MFMNSSLTFTHKKCDRTLGVYEQPVFMNRSRTVHSQKIGRYTCLAFRYMNVVFKRAPVYGADLISDRPPLLVKGGGLMAGLAGDKGNGDRARGKPSCREGFLAAHLARDQVCGLR